MQKKLPVFCSANVAWIAVTLDKIADLTNIRYELSVLRWQVAFLSSYLRSLPVWKVESNCDEYGQ